MVPSHLISSFTDLVLLFFSVSYITFSCWTRFSTLKWRQQVALQLYLLSQNRSLEGSDLNAAQIAPLVIGRTCILERLTLNFCWHTSGFHDIPPFFEF